MSGIKNTTGGVSPFKKGEKGAGSGKSKSRKVRAGDVGKKATATAAQDRSGYSRSGADYVNVHSFTGNTRFSSSLANTLGPSLKSAVSGKSNKGGAKQIGTDAGGNPVYNYNYHYAGDYAEGDIDKRTIKGDYIEGDVDNRVATSVITTGQNASSSSNNNKKSNITRNFFAEACLNANGSRKPSGSKHSVIDDTDPANPKTLWFLCEWAPGVTFKGNKSNGSTINASDNAANISVTQFGEDVNTEQNIDSKNK